MIEIKVECPCSARFKFDVEPVEGRMPMSIACPSCGADATELANQALHLATRPPSPPAATPAPRIASLSTRPSTPASITPETPSPMHSVPESRPAAPPLPSEASEGRMSLGILGAVAAGAVGMILWFLLIKWTGYEIGYAAWGVGLLTGCGARVACHSGGKTLGMIAGFCAFIAIVGGQFLAASSASDEAFRNVFKSAYQQQLAYAKSAAELKTDADIGKFLKDRGDWSEEEDEETTPAKEAKPAAKKAAKSAEPSAKAVKQFREERLPQLIEFAAGKPSESEYLSKMAALQKTWFFRLIVLKESFGFFTLLWIFLGVSSAYKLAANEP